MAVFVQDTFTDTNGVMLDAHTPDVGAAPDELTARIFGEVGGTTVRPSIQGNTAMGSTANSPATPIYRYPTDPGSDDYDVTADLSFGPAVNNTNTVIYVGLSPTGTAFSELSGYYIVALNTSTQSWFLGVIVDGEFGVEEEFADAMAGQTRQVKVEYRSGGNVTVYIGGVQRMQKTGAAVTQRGRVGIGLSHGDTGQFLDNLVGDSVGGTTVVGGTAAASLAFTGTAAGTPTTTGTAAGSFSLTATATGTVTTTGTASGDYSLTAAGSGTVTEHGTAAGSYTLTATATGQSGTTGTASGAFTLAATAAGTVTTVGTATADIAFTGTATGAASEPDTGTASGDYTLTATATGHPTTIGEAAGSYTVTATATGHPVTHGTAAATFVFTGTAAGFSGTTQTPASRTYTVPVYPRTYPVLAYGRIYDIPSESRLVEVT